jgi:hypothetical protein
LFSGKGVLKEALINAKMRSFEVQADVFLVKAGSSQRRVGADGLVRRTQMSCGRDTGLRAPTARSHVSHPHATRETETSCESWSQLSHRSHLSHPMRHVGHPVRRRGAGKGCCDCCQQDCTKICQQVVRDRPLVFEREFRGWQMKHPEAHCDCPSSATPLALRWSCPD